MHSPSSVVKNDVIVSSPKPMKFPAATDISYIVYGVRLFISYSFTFPVVMFRISEFSFFNLIQIRERSCLPGFLGSSHDISALLDVMSVTVRFIGLSGNAARGKSRKYNFEMYNKWS